MTVWRYVFVADLEALHCQPGRNFDRSTTHDLTTEPPLLDRCRCAFGVFFRLGFHCRFGLALALEALLKALVERWLVRLLNVLTNSVGFTFYLLIPLLCPTCMLL